MWNEFQPTNLNYLKRLPESKRPFKNRPIQEGPLVSSPYKPGNMHSSGITLTKSWAH